MSDNTGDTEADLWAWLDEPADEGVADPAAYPVSAFIVSARGGRSAQRCREAVDAGRFAPVSVSVVDHVPPDADGIWLWILPDTCEPTVQALAQLVERVRAQPASDVVGALLVEPPRRGPGTLVSDWAVSMTANGRVLSAVGAGELFQGQLETRRALGVPAAGMLVRGDVWRALGGFNELLPAALWGLDFGWRVNLAGGVVVADPRAQIVDRGGAEDPALVRSAALAMTAAHSPRGRRWLTAAWLTLVSLAAALGYLLGKDMERAGDEFRGWLGWLGDARLRRSLAASLAMVPVTATSRAATRGLLPRPGAGLRRQADELAVRLAEWAETFTRRGSAPGLDELSGDDSAGPGPGRGRMPILAAGASTILLLAVVAGRGLVGAGALTGPQLLPAPATAGDFLAGYIAAVPGATGASGPGWLGLAGLASLVTVGSPEVLVSLVVLGCVPLAWLAAYRLLRQLLDDTRIAALAAAAYALAPVLTGALNLGLVGVAAWTVLLPVAGYALWWWAGPGRGTWRGAAAVSLWLLLACALTGVSWVVALCAAVVAGVRDRRLWPKLALVLATPLLLLAGSWAGTLLRYPGRLLTGIEPSLAPSLAPEPWTVVVAATGGSAGPPWWLSVPVVGVLWLAALAGASRRPGVASAALAAAGGAASAALLLTRLVVWVPPGAWARPQAGEWVVAMIGGLVLAAAVGLDGLGAELRGRSLGARHVAALALMATAVAAVATASVWWVLAGQTGLSRGPVGGLPAFVREAQVSATPGRTFALQVAGDSVGWSLVEGDFPRLGDSERGLVVSGDARAMDTAASVAARLVSGAADEDLAEDLVRLGVSHLWLGGGGPELRTRIGNVPGLGVGTGDAAQMVWPVPDSGLVVVESADGRTVVGDGSDLAAGPEGRRLVLSQPVDPRWEATAGGVRLDPVAMPDGRQAFDLGTRGGQLELDLVADPSWWAWLQLVGLLALAVLAAPGVRRKAPQTPSRRVEAAAPRRAAGGRP